MKPDVHDNQLLYENREKYVGLFSGVFSAKQTYIAKSSGRFNQEIVGESHYQRQLKKLCGGYSKDGSRVEADALLVPEDKNRHDKNAVRIEVAGKIVGYLSRQDAKYFRRKVKKTEAAEKNVTCKALIVGGKKLGLFERSNFGVWLDLDMDDI